MSGLIIYPTTKLFECVMDVSFLFYSIICDIYFSFYLWHKEEKCDLFECT